jgi:hypothetical protein
MCLGLPPLGKWLFFTFGYVFVLVLCVLFVASIGWSILEARSYWSFLANSSIKVVCSSRIITLFEKKEVRKPFGHYRGRVGLVI